MPFRRRPIRRVAVTGAVGAAAYNAGKNKNSAPPPPSTAAPSPAGSGTSADPVADKTEIYDAIAKLGELKESGLLSDEEFQREKLRLLDG